MTAGRRIALGAVLLVLAVLVWVLRTSLADGGPHSWDPSAKPPSSVTLTRGQTYAISIPGGPADLIARQNNLAPQLSCTATSDGSVVSLPITVDVSDQRVTDRVGTFVSPVSGRAAVACSGLGTVFVDDADDAAFDTATGLVVLVALLALAGIALLLSGLYRRPVRPTPADHRAPVA